MSGLTAAREMEKKGLTVQVVEALPRLGGRLWRNTLSPVQAIDYGAQWVGKTHTNALALLEELGLKTFKWNSAVEGSAFFFDGESARFGLDMNLSDWKLPGILNTGPWIDGAACIAKFKKGGVHDACHRVPLPTSTEMVGL